MVYTFRKQNLTLPVQGMQLITCYAWVDAGPHGEGVWLTGGVGPMWRDHQLPRDKAASDRARSICHAVLGATIGAQTKRAKLNFLQEPSVWSMQQGGKENGHREKSRRCKCCCSQLLQFLCSWHHDADQLYKFSQTFNQVGEENPGREHYFPYFELPRCCGGRGRKTCVAGWHCYPESFCASGKFLRV